MDVIKRELKSMRARAELTQADMAEKLNVSLQSYQRWEKDPQAIPIEKLNAIFGVFGTTFEEVFFKDEFDKLSKL